MSDLNLENIVGFKAVDKDGYEQNVTVDEMVDMVSTRMVMALSETSTFAAAAALEAWKTDSLGIAEEIGICRIEIAQSTLQGLGVDFRKPLMLHLQLALHQVCQIYVAECFLALLVCRDFQIQCPVIDKATATEGLGKQYLLFICRIDSIFVGT